MTTKEFIEMAVGIDVRIASLDERLRMLKEKPMSITAPIGGTGSSGSGTYDKLGAKVAEMIDEEQAIINIRDKFLRYKEYVEKSIHKIPDNILAALLEEKYIKCKTWEQTAYFIGYDVDYTQKTLHSKALIEFDKVTPEKDGFNPVIS